MIIPVKVRPFFHVHFTSTINMATSITIRAGNNGTCNTVTAKIIERTTTVLKTALNIVDFVLVSLLSKGKNENTIIPMALIQANIFTYILLVHFYFFHTKWSSFSSHQ